VLAAVLAALGCAEAQPGGDVGHPADDVETTMLHSPRDGGFASYGLMTINLHCFKTEGSAFGNNDDRFGQIARGAADQNVAVIAAQEVCQRGDAFAARDLRAALERATQHEWSFSWMPAHVGWQGTPDEANEGVAVFVRGRIDDGKVVFYSFHHQNSLRRVMVGVQLPDELGGYHVFSIHLAVEEWHLRAAQAREAAAIALAAPWPRMDVIVAGDFNDHEATAPITAMIDWGYRNVTQGVSSGFRIDHIFQHRASWLASRGARAIFDGSFYPRVSDHEGYLAWVGPGVGDSVPATQLVADIDVGFGNWLAVRGGTWPLSWDEGVPAFPVSGTQWRIIASEITGGSEFKWLLNDSRWQSGGNLWVDAGAEHRMRLGF